MGIIMKYPSFKTIEATEKIESGGVEKLMATIMNCIESVYTEETIFYAKDVSSQELSEFVESLTREQFAKVQLFFETMPEVKKEVHFKCPKCSYEEDIEIKGLQNFFV